MSTLQKNNSEFPNRRVVKKVKSFEQFVSMQLETWHPIHYNLVVYRGVPDKKFGLRPVIGRRTWTLDGEPGPGSLLNFERNLLEEFQRKAPAYFKAVPIGDLDWLCLARHHGMATRLLDWTTNPLVALFFAVDADMDTDFAVYTYWTTTHSGDTGTMTLESIQRMKESLLFYPRLTNERYVRQSSVMMLCHRPSENFKAWCILKTSGK